MGVGLFLFLITAVFDVGCSGGHHKTRPADFLVDPRAFAQADSLRQVSFGPHFILGQSRLAAASRLTQTLGRMISFRVQSHRFHLRAGAVALENEHVLLHRLEGEDFWALPGGRVEAGEQAEHTIVREFIEELGVRVRCNQMLGVGENFFEYDGEPHHEIGLYFSATLAADTPLRDKGSVHIGVEGNCHLEFKWFPLSQLREIDFRPTALRESLSVGQVPQHFVQRGTNAA